MTGRLRTGTSGFAYPGWAPRFYPPGARGEALLRFYGSRLGTVELNNTFYRQPSPSAVDGWLAATPSDFRFAVKAQRGGSFRADELRAWLDRLEPFLADGLDAYVFFRHDEVGRGAELALELAALAAAGGLA